MKRLSSLFLFLVALFPTPGPAEVLDASGNGFTSQNSVSIPAPPARVYALLVQGVDIWWSSDHTFSGSAANLRIDARQGGCFCEVLPNGGSVRHLTVVNADPGKLLRLTGGLGPLQAEGVTGSLSWALSDSEDGTQVTLTYAVGGYAAGGLDSWSEAVDRVVGEQLGRLARFVATGNPEESPAASDPGDGAIE